jgi:hypothetical protein
VASHGRRRAIRLSLPAACAVSLMALAPPAHGEMPPGMRAIAEGGFGQVANGYAWSMAWFRGRLYVGTARDPLCVERATMDFYLPSLGSYRQHPAPGVRCPPSIDAADLRAEIWQYTPGSGRWARVYRSPRVPNPRAPGKAIARDIGYRGMVVVKRPGRPAALLVAGLSADEFVPELRRRSPPRILRTTDGRHFRPVRGGPGLIRGPRGVARPVGYRAMAVVDGKLYVTASAGLTGDGVILRLRGAGGSSPRFTQVSPAGLSVFEIAAFDGHLYAGTGDAQQGYGVWRMGGGPRPQWQPVVTGGAGRGATMTSVVSMEPYGGRLYVGASGWGTSPFPASELISVAPGGDWDVVVGNARQVAGAVRAPVSGLPDGFGNDFNLHFWRMQAYRGALLLGTNDWSWSLAGIPRLDRRIRAEFGFDLYATCDGTHWWAATRNGFGQPTDFGVRTMAASPAGLFIGTTDHIRGATVLRARRPPCAGGRRAWPARPPAVRMPAAVRRRAAATATGTAIHATTRRVG